MPPKNVELRMRQHRAAAIGAPSLAASFVAGKIRNSRTLIRRHARKGAGAAVDQLAELAKAADRERGLESLLGLEGTAARIYFSCFADLLARGVDRPTFAFDKRHRRPPTDPVNALLSFFYALLIKDVTVAALAAGLDPYVGFYHRRGLDARRSRSTSRRSSARSSQTLPSSRSSTPGRLARATLCAAGARSRSRAPVVVRPWRPTKGGCGPNSGTLSSSTQQATGVRWNSRRVYSLRFSWVTLPGTDP